MSHHHTATPTACSMALNSALFIVLAAIAFLMAPSPASAAPIELRRYGDTVSGIPNTPGTTNGFIGESRLDFPFALCGTHLSALEDPNGDMLLIGTSRYFRTFNRTSGYTGVWFGGDVSGDMDGPIESAQVSTVYGCTRYNNDNPVIYYVTGTSDVRYVSNGVVSSVQVAPNLVLQDVAVFNNQLFVVDGQRTYVYQCRISTSNPTPQGCAQITLNNLATVPRSPGLQRGITVNTRGMFIATGAALVWYTNPTGNAAATIVQLDSAHPLVDIKTLSTAGTQTTLVGVSSTGVYTITATASNTWSLSLFAGTGEQSACTSADDNLDGFNPTFCGLYRLFPLSLDEVYFSLSDRNVVRSLKLPPMIVNYTFYRRPFPIGFYESEADMNQLIGLMNSNLNGALGTTEVTVNPNTGYVEPTWWDTLFQVEVPQRNFDNVTTVPTIEGLRFDETLHQLVVYYNYTNENVYTDFNIMPTCNRTQLNFIQHQIAYLARSTLTYPLIYTNPPETLTIGANPNITRVKLLMPARFGTAPGFDYNETTHPLIEAANFTEAIIGYVSESYSPSRVYTVKFTPSTKFPFQNLNDDQLQQVRWIIQQNVKARLAQCAAQVGDPADGGQSGTIGGAGSGSSSDDGLSELVPGCVPKIGITNETYVQNPGQTGYETDYTVFVPNTMNFTFDIADCLDGMDNDDIGYWIGNATVTKRSRKCGTGCIVGVAVAAAVVAMILIVVLVVLVSKRKRLATVVAPAAAGAEPKFASTLDDYEDSIGSTGNPLQRE